MSIDAISTTTPGWSAQASGVSAVTSDATAASSITASTNATGLGNFFQQFATDLQSLLTQVQATSGSGAATATSTTTAATPPADGTGQTATAQTAAQPPGAVQHHHEHHGGGGPLQNAATQFVGQVAQAFGGRSGNPAPAAGTTANAANTLATDIVRALQHYGAFASPAASTVSTTA